MSDRMSWIQTGNTYRSAIGDVFNVESLPKGIYDIDFAPFTGWSITKTADEFTFNYKIYDLETDFINHVITAFNNCESNLGVLMYGTRGSGKSASAKIICNKINLPIFVIKPVQDMSTSNLIDYISTFNFDCVFLFDEFEKNFSKEDSSILSIMDGVYTSKYRRLFILTTNNLSVNENLLSRPSRIRYLKEFGNLSLDAINNYLDDNLSKENYEHKDEIISYIDTLEISTIDILKCIVDEIRIFGYDEFIKSKKFFNTKTNSYNYYIRYEVFDIDEASDKKAFDDYSVSKFIEDIKNLKLHPKPNKFDYETDDEFVKAMTNWKSNYGPARSINTYSVSNIEKRWDLFKPNEEFWPNDSRVIKVDKENNVIVSIDDDNNIYFMYIDNPTSAPSLYKSVIDYVL